MIKEKMEYYLFNQGYVRMATGLIEFTVYFKIENNYVNAVQLVDCVKNPELTNGQYYHATENVSGRFLDRGYADVHVLSILLTEDLWAAREICTGDSFCWMIDTVRESLVVDAEKTIDFYGMRKGLEDCLEMESIPQMQTDTVMDAVTYRLPVKRIQPFVNRTLVILNIFIFTVCVLTGEMLYNIGTMNISAILGGQWYRLITATFLHADINHLVGNMLILYFLGGIVERALGHVKYLILYFLAGLGASFISFSFALMRFDFRDSLGASGAIFGMIGALLWVALRNRGQAETVTAPRILFLIVYSIYSGLTSTNVDNVAHIGGLVIGIFLCIVLYHKKKAVRDEVVE